MDPNARAVQLLAAGSMALPAGASLSVVGNDPILASRHHIGEAAAAAAGLAAAWAASFGERRGGPGQSIRIEVQAATATLVGFLFQAAETLPDLRREFSPVTSMFQTIDDRIIHLHGGFPHLADGTARLLGCQMEPVALADAVARWAAADLEDALAAAGLCGAIVRSPAEWAAHPQGRAVASLPAIRLRRLGDAGPTTPPPSPRPLSGVRVLDLTRVLAGPTAGRTLAVHGADVLRVDHPGLPTIDVFDIDTGRGKRSAFADLTDPDDAARIEALLADADIVVQSYRPGALDRHGLGAEALHERHPGIVVVQLSCYGPEGPWSERRGWEQLAQSAGGLAWSEEPDDPRLVPAAATDYTTGYLAAAGAAMGLCARFEDGGSWLVEVSLAQTAAWLGRLGADLDPSRATGLGDLTARQEHRSSAWGTLTQLAPIEEMIPTGVSWDHAPVPRGSSALAWR